MPRVDEIKKEFGMNLSRIGSEAKLYCADALVLLNEIDRLKAENEALRVLARLLADALDRQ